MKLIIQSDDFGITEAVSCGIVKGVREGMITCTGLFSNMSASAFAAELIKPYDVCLGQDINIVAGEPCSDSSLIPCMVNENGYFLNANEHRKLDETAENNDHLVYEECLIEVEAQIKRFIELTGKKPEYLHGHSYGTATLGKAMHKMSEKYDIPITFDLYQKYKVKHWKENWTKKPFLLEDQIKADPLSIITNDEIAPLDAEIALIGTHCGYVDEELFKYSSYTLIRNKDLYAITSDTMKKWMKKHKCELISFRDLMK